MLTGQQVENLALAIHRTLDRWQAEAERRE